MVRTVFRANIPHFYNSFRVDMNYLQVNFTPNLQIIHHAKLLNIENT